MSYQSRVFFSWCSFGCLSEGDCASLTLSLSIPFHWTSHASPIRKVSYAIVPLRTMKQESHSSAVLIKSFSLFESRFSSQPPLGSFFSGPYSFLGKGSVIPTCTVAINQFCMKPVFVLLCPLSPDWLSKSCPTNRGGFLSWCSFGCFSEGDCVLWLFLLIFLLTEPVTLSWSGRFLTYKPLSGLWSRSLILEGSWSLNFSVKSVALLKMIKLLCLSSEYGY